MKRAVLALALAACPAPRAGDTTGHPAAPATVVSAVQGALEQWRQAYEVRSLDALDKLYAHDPELVVVQDGPPLVGWPAVDAMLKDRLGHAKEVHVRLKDIRIAARGSEVATAIAAMAREISDGTTTVTEQGTLTFVFQRDGDGWHIVVEQFSYKRPGG